MMPLLFTVFATAHAGCDTAASTDVTVVTLNTWGLPAPVARDRRGRMPRITRWLEDQGYDVAGLQEVWRGAVKLLRIPSARDDRDGDSGLALVTPHPVSHLEQHSFEAERGFDRLKAKGWLKSEIAVDGGTPLVVVTTHLQAGGGPRNATVRALQVGEILDGLADETRAVTLLGDFNLYEGEATDKRTRMRLEAAGFVDVAAAAGATGGTYPGVVHRFDRIFVRDGTQRCVVPRTAKVLDTELSDHSFVQARFNFH